MKWAVEMRERMKSSILYTGRLVSKKRYKVLVKDNSSTTNDILNKFEH